MIPGRLPLALLLAVTLLVPAEAHVVTGGCLPGFHTTAPAMVVQQAPAPSHRMVNCATHHQGERPVRGAMQHCGVPSTCAASVALLEGHASVIAEAAEIAAPTLFPTTPSSRVTPPGTPPPRF
jgi:hypothetical protein